MYQDPQESALGVLNLSKSYLQAAEHLFGAIASQRLCLKFSHPLSFLLGHAIELVVKAALLHWGTQAPKKHDLASLRVLAIDKGSALALSKVEKCHFELLTEFFGTPPYEVRYLKTGYRQAHNDEIILSIAKKFANEITSLIRSVER